MPNIVNRESLFYDKGAVQPAEDIRDTISNNERQVWKGVASKPIRLITERFGNFVANTQALGWSSKDGCNTFAIGWLQVRDMGGALSVDDDADVMRRVQRRRQLKRETEELQMLIFIVSVIDNEMD